MVRKAVFLSFLVTALTAAPASAQKLKKDDPIWSDATTFLCNSDEEGHLQRNAEIVIRDIGVSRLDDAANDRIPTALALRGIGEYEGIGGFPRNRQSARKDFKAAAKAGHPLGSGWYAAYAVLSINPRDVLKALEKSDSANCPIAKLTHALWFLTKSDDKDRAKSQRKGLLILEELSNEGYASAQFVLSASLRGGTNGVQRDPARGIKLLTAAADDGMPAAMSALANSYLDGLDVPKNPEKAMEIFLKMAEAGGTDGYIELGEYYLEGKVIAQDLDKAQRYFDLGEKGGVVPKPESKAKLARLVAAREERAAKARKAEAERQALLARKARYERACLEANASGCFYLSRMYADGEGVPKDPEKSVQLSKQACNLALGEGCLHLGLIYVEKKQQVLAVEYFEKACTLDMSSGCLNAGVRYRDGSAGRIDLAKALQLYKVGCDKLNDKYNCREAGLLYRDGRGTARSLTMAHQYFRKACDLSYSWACHDMALAYSEGEGVPVNKARARQYHEKGCNLGDWKGCAALSSLLFDGEGGPADAKRGIELQKKGCGFNEPDACLLLGLALRRGIRVPTNHRESMIYLKKACELNSADGCYLVGANYQLGDGVARDAGKAARYYRRALAINPSDKDAKEALSKIGR